jgi:hypothetical protein
MATPGDIDLGVVAPSGVLVVVDAGYLDLWQHDRPPHLQRGTLWSDDATAAADSAVEPGDE